MLLANMAVAHHITNKFSEVAVLRRHPPPQTRMIDELVSISQPSLVFSTRCIHRTNHRVVPCLSVRLGQACIVIIRWTLARI